MSHSVIADDPRVRRQGDLLADEGHDVVAVGFTGGQSPQPRWSVVGIQQPARSFAADAGVALRYALARSTTLVRAAYWSMAVNRRMYDHLVQSDPEFVIGNDWRALPVVTRLAKARGIAYAYDAHEMSPEQFTERTAWKLIYPHVIRSIEGDGARRATFVSTVSDGIADRMQELYGLQTRPLVIRNVPPRHHPEACSTAEPMVVLYHGLFTPERGLEALIDSVALWEPGRSLVIRGTGPPKYVQAIRKRIDASPASDRVALEPPAPMMDLVRLAMDADVGIHPHSAETDQGKYLLPNKLFEYLAAGLAVAVRGLPEMRRIVEEYGVGIVFDESSPEAIAAAVNSLSQESVDRFRLAATDAHARLNWEVESERLLGALRTVDRERAAREDAEIRVESSRTGRRRHLPRSGH